jgi:transglycosylase-like protein with SLT domain
MQRIAFCSRCRGMRVGYNERYIIHCLICKEWISKSSKLLILTVLLTALLFAVPVPNAFVFSENVREQPVQAASFEGPVPSQRNPVVRSIEGFLQQHEIDEANRNRVAEAIADSARKYNLEPRLIASIMIIESRANPFAISGADSVGIMQVHLPTWGHTAEKEGVNLFKIEDNIDFGSRILSDYVRQFGLWEGVKRYKGWMPENPESENSALEYVAKVQRIYGLQQSAATETAQLVR